MWLGMSVVNLSDWGRAQSGVGVHRCPLVQRGGPSITCIDGSRGDVKYSLATRTRSVGAGTDFSLTRRGRHLLRVSNPASMAQGLPTLCCAIRVGTTHYPLPGFFWVFWWVYQQKTHCGFFYKMFLAFLHFFHNLSSDSVCGVAHHVLM